MNSGRDEEPELPKRSQEVIVTDVRIPFGSMVVLLLKLFLATIPVMIILFVLSSAFQGAIWGSGLFWFRSIIPLNSINELLCLPPSLVSYWWYCESDRNCNTKTTTIMLP